MYATPPGQRSEIHWVPANAPQTARVLVEGLEGSRRVYRHRGELWWWEKNLLMKGDLVGQQAQPLSEFGNNSLSDMVRQGDMLYWISGRVLGSFNLSTGERKIIMTEPTTFGGIAIHEDRLYFGIGAEIQTMRLDGKDRRPLGSLDDSTLRRRGGVLDLAVHDGRLLWLDRSRLFQADLTTGDVAELSRLGETPRGGIFGGFENAMTVTDEAVYWIDGRTVLRWRHGAEEHEPLYELGDTQLSAITAVTAFPAAATFGQKGRVQVKGDKGETYQLLYSEDLQSWSPDFVQRSLFTGQGVLAWLNSKLGQATEPITWRPQAVGRQAYFSAWRYEFGDPYDADEDELPDYWERRHFGDLSATPEGDANGDGMSHREEAGLYVSPLDVDSDGDGLTDTEEVLYDPPLNPGTVDTDGDTLTDGDEVKVHGTTPHAIDTDFDGSSDEFEIAFGSDPTDRTSRPPSDDVLATYADDLTVHFDFESRDREIVSNRGVIGGSGQIVGPVDYVSRERLSGEVSTALEFPSGSNDSKSATSVQTKLTLAAIGLTGPENGFTISLWIRTERVHTGTILSAARELGPEQAVAFRVEGRTFSPGNDATPLSLTLKGHLWSSSSNVSGAVPPGVWTHLCWVHGVDGRRLYIDGILRSFESRIGLWQLESAPKLWLGAQMGSERPTVPFHGAIDDVRVYRGVLSKNVIKVLARE